MHTTPGVVPIDRTIVAVDEDLGPYREAIRQAGYHVVPVSDHSVADAACIVVDGIDDRIMGIETALTPAPVINVTGMTAEQVVQEVRKRTQK